VKPRNKKTLVRAAFALATLLILLLAGCAKSESAQSPTPADSSQQSAATSEHAGGEQHAEAEGATTVEMIHVHGLGFSPDGSQLIVPAHDGLRIYADGKWVRPDVAAHDYMGYTPSSDGFYSSGHPDPSSGLVNPFGLIKSTDGGKTLAKLGFEGETDFHFMAVGFQNHAIYVGNPAANSILSAGVHYSLDDGQTWQQSALAGVSGQLIQMAVHPVDANQVALATEDGLWLSSDYGNTFTQVGDAGTVTAVTFSPDGKTLLFGYQGASGYDLASQQSVAMTTPMLGADDAIGYLAVNPVQADEIALSTFNKDIYLSQDGGKSWIQIAENGKGQ
jgi:hypothetical protein